MGLPSASYICIFFRKTRRLAALAFGCPRAFFVCNTELAQRLPDGLGRHAKPRGALVLVSVRVVPHILSEFIRVKLAGLFTHIRLGFQTVRPALNRRNPDRKPISRLRKTQTPSVLNLQNMAAE